MAQEMTPQPLKSNNYSPAMISTSIGELLPNPIRWLSSSPIFYVVLLLYIHFHKLYHFFFLVVAVLIEINFIDW